MATIRKVEGSRGATYSVQVRIRPYQPTNRSFKKLAEAKRWAEKTELEMREGRYGVSSESRKRLFSDAVLRYEKYVLPTVKKSRRDHVLKWWNKAIGHLSLKDVTPALIAEIRDRLSDETIKGKKRAPGTIVKYLAVLSHVLTMCVNEWQWLENNPVAKVSKPSMPRGRVRFLDDFERERLLEACKESSNPYLFIIVVLGISTGMRKSEIMNLNWKDIDFERGRIVLHETKNGEVRVVPLVGMAYELLELLEKKRRIDSTLLFPSPNSARPRDFRSAWRVAIKKAGLSDFKFHDTRHSFASYCVMNGSSLNEVADLLGHKSYQTVTKRYCHLSEAYRKDVVSSMNDKIFKDCRMGINQ